MKPGYVAAGGVHEVVAAPRDEPERKFGATAVAGGPLGSPKVKFFHDRRVVQPQARGAIGVSRRNANLQRLQQAMGVSGHLVVI